MSNNIIRMYKKEELKQINIMFEKEENNLIFTGEELEFANQFDLSDPYTGIVGQRIWKYRNNGKMLKLIGKMLEDNGIKTFKNVLGGNI